MVASKERDKLIFSIGKSIEFTVRLTRLIDTSSTENVVTSLEEVYKELIKKSHWGNHTAIKLSKAMKQGVYYQLHGLLSYELLNFNSMGIGNINKQTKTKASKTYLLEIHTIINKS